MLDTTVKFIQDGAKITLISEKYHYTMGYYSRNPWVSDDVCVLARQTDVTVNNGSELVAVDFAAQKVHELGIFSSAWSDFVVHGETLYWIKDGVLYSRNVWGGDVKKIAEMPGMNFPHMTADGRYLNWKAVCGDKYCGFVCDVQTGEITQLCAMRFMEPFPEADHMMICPTNPDIMFFTHEGGGGYNTNRLWIAEKGRAPRCIVRQNLDHNGVAIDQYGHEMWAPDGKGLWCVKYPFLPTSTHGLTYVDIDTGDTTLRYSKYNYWHCATSPDGRYLAADICEGPSGVCIIDLATGEEKLLVENVLTSGQHPGHPHPCFSPASKYVGYGHKNVDMITVSVVRL